MSNESNATLPVKLSVLPDSWVERIFSRMMAYYGTLFSDRWRDSNLHEVKAVWAEELASFSDNPECFKRALAAMVDGSTFPPTLPEFKAMCRANYKRPQMVAIEHKLSPEDMERNRERARQMAARLGRRMAA
jgi:hypothetical protein